MTNTSTTQHEARKTVHELIKDIDIAMLTTVSTEGLVSRPMKTQEIEFDGDLWFLTKKDSRKFHELLHNKQVNVAYVGQSYISIRGEAELVDSPEKLRDIWNPMYEKFLETTIDDPELILIKVKAETAEYWDSGNKLKMIQFITRKMMGKNTEDTNINQVVELT